MLPLIVIFIPAIVICFLKSLFSRRQKVEDVAGKVVMITGASSGLGEGKYDNKNHPERQIEWLANSLLVYGAVFSGRRGRSDVYISFT